MHKDLSSHELAICGEVMYKQYDDSNDCVLLSILNLFYPLIDTKLPIPDASFGLKYVSDINSILAQININDLICEPWYVNHIDIGSLSLNPLIPDDKDTLLPMLLANNIGHMVAGLLDNDGHLFIINPNKQDIYKMSCDKLNYSHAFLFYYKNGGRLFGINKTWYENINF